MGEEPQPTFDCQLRTHDQAGMWQVVGGEEGRPGVRKNAKQESPNPQSGVALRLAGVCAAAGGPRLLSANWGYDASCLLTRGRKSGSLLELTYAERTARLLPGDPKSAPGRREIGTKCKKDTK